MSGDRKPRARDRDASGSNRGSAGKLPFRWIVPSVFAIAILIAVFVIPRLGHKDQIQMIADALRVDRDRVTVNIPPNPLRYPGAVLLAIEGDRALYAEGNDKDPDLLPPQGPYRLTAEYAADGSAKGSVETSFFKEVASHQDVVEIEFGCEDTTTVEMTFLKLREHLAKLGFTSPKDEGTRNKVVIYRALKGSVQYKFKRRTDSSVEEWTKFAGEMGTVVKDTPDIEMKLDATQKSSDALTVQFKSPIVFAFLAAEVAEVLDATRTSDPTPAPGASPSGSPAPAIKAMLELDPSHIPALPQAMAELGSGAAAALVKEMQPPDAERRDRAAMMLALARPPADANAADPIADLKSTSPPVRAWALRHLEARGAQPLSALIPSLDDRDPAVRHIAITAIGAKKEEDAARASALEHATNDSDPGIRLRASSSLLKLDPNSARARATLESGLRSGVASERRGAALYIGRDRLKSLSETGNPELKEAAVRAMREVPR